jgi:cobalt-zinc-cadmium efflux system membrane fusion protein
MMLPQRKLMIGTAAATIALAGGWWLSTGRQPPPAPAASTPTRPAASDVIPLASAQVAMLGIRWAAAEPATEAAIASLPATIAPPANARVAVTALYPGLVRRILVVQGDEVRAGQTLAIVASAEVLSGGADLARAESRVGVARANARRTRQLAQEGIIAGSRDDEAQALLHQAETDVSEQRRLLAMGNAASSGGTYTLKAPIAGRVSEMTAQAGSAIDSTRAPFIIDATDSYEIRAQLPQRLVGSVRPGMTIRLADGLVGKVTSIGNVIDPETRSAMLKARVPAGPGIVSGGSATVALYGPAPDRAVIVPETAVINIGGRDMVFVRAEGGVKPRAVKRGEAIAGRTLILSGLNPGEQVVAAGTSELKALAQAR